MTDLTPGQIIYFAVNGRYDRTAIVKVDDRRAYCLKLKIMWIDGKWVGYHGLMQTKVNIKPETEKIKAIFLAQRKEQKDKIIRETI